jgi:hypothetical protein
MCLVKYSFGLSAERVRGSVSAASILAFNLAVDARIGLGADQNGVILSRQPEHLLLRLAGGSAVRIALIA